MWSSEKFIVFFDVQQMIWYNTSVMQKKCSNTSHKKSVDFRISIELQKCASFVAALICSSH